MYLQKTKKEIIKKNCVIEIFGIGYVGFPLCIRLASSGFNIIGIDTDENRLKRLESNQLKQSENDLKEQFIELRSRKKILLSKSSAEFNLPKIGIICVPTPISRKHTNSNIFINFAVKNFLSCSKKGDVLIIESSLEIGSFENIKSMINEYGFSVGENFGLAYCPERIDPLNKKWELHNIPRIIYCENNDTFDIAHSIYENINQANLIRVSSSKVAELVKSFENSFRLVNISLVNELAILCDKINVNISEVISAASTKPFGFIPFYSGAGAGGHCIPKDSISLYNSGKKFGFEFSIVRKAIEINSLVPKYIVESVEKILSEKDLPRKVLVIGLAYKENLEDSRDSPGLKISHELVKKSIDVEVFDPFFNSDSFRKKNENFKILENLEESHLEEISCIIIVQHHSKMKQIIQKIYDDSVVSIIYDCQSKLIPNLNSSTILKSFG